MGAGYISGNSWADRLQVGVGQRGTHHAILPTVLLYGCRSSCSPTWVATGANTPAIRLTKCQEYDKVRCIGAEERISGREGQELGAQGFNRNPSKHAANAATFY